MREEIVVDINDYGFYEPGSVFKKDENDEEEFILLVSEKNEGDTMMLATPISKVHAEEEFLCAQPHFLFSVDTRTLNPKLHAGFINGEQLLEIREIIRDMVPDETYLRY